MEALILILIPSHTAPIPELSKKDCVTVSVEYLLSSDDYAVHRDRYRASSRDWRAADEAGAAAAITAVILFLFGFRHDEGDDQIGDNTDT